MKTSTRWTKIPSTGSANTRGHARWARAACVLAALLVVAGCSSSTGSSPDKSSPDKSSTDEASTLDIPTGEIVFRRFDEDHAQAVLMVMNTDGSDSRQVTEPGAAEVDNLPDWSPDGTQIAFERQPVGAPTEVYVVGADGSDEHVVDPGCPAARPQGPVCEETGPSWSPDGSRLLFGWPSGSDAGGRVEVVAVGVMDADGGNVEQLTNLESPTTYEDAGGVWSPDAAQIAFIRKNTTAEPVDAMAVFVMAADGTDQHQITPWELRADDIAWAPDGSLLSFRSEPDASQPFIGDLYTVAPDGSELTNITQGEPGTMTLGSSWSPDSQWIVFAASGVEDNPDLYLMRRDGSDLTPLTQTPVWDSAPDWSPAAG